MDRKRVINRMMTGISGVALVVLVILVISISTNAKVQTGRSSDAAVIGQSLPRTVVELRDEATATNAEGDAVGDDDDDDDDGLPDQWESYHQLNTNDRTAEQGAAGDPDGDGLNNIDEYYNDTDPHKVDTDDDGMPDLWEVENNLDPTDATSDHGNSGDLDGDGVSNGDEYDNGTDPSSSDTNQDGTSDGVEHYARRAKESGDTINAMAPDGEVYRFNGD